MKRIIVFLSILLLFCTTVTQSKVLHFPDENLYIIAHPVEPERKVKTTPDEVDPDNEYFDVLGLILPDEPMTYKINGSIPVRFIASMLYSSTAWNEVLIGRQLETISIRSSNITNNYWYANDGENVISFVKFTPRDYIAFAAIYYDPDLIDPGTGFMTIVDADIVLNSLHKWDVDPDGDGPIKIKAFDVQNILTHELGHVIGLSDLYEDQYRELTIYGYASKGETMKITLEAGDIAGARFIYGL